MANKAMWDWMDKAEGRKDSSHENMQKERKRQGYQEKAIKGKVQQTKFEKKHGWDAGMKKAVREDRKLGEYSRKHI